MTPTEGAAKPVRPVTLTSRALHPVPTVVNCGGVAIGGGAVVLIAGPCSVEGREMLLETARAAQAAGAVMLRGGAFKPRSTPYTFQGLGEEGLRYLAEARHETGLPVVTEVMAPEQVDLVASYADMLQIGARNMQNFSLLQAVGRQRKPVMLKRGMMASLSEWLGAAEYILAQGNDQVILCERGIRTFETYTRFTLDLSAVPAIKRLTHLPIIVDPSHATGMRDLVIPMAMAGIAAGADGVIVEAHPYPESALCDGPQSLTLTQIAELHRSLAAAASAVGRRMHPPVGACAAPAATAGDR
jgi:3-deoxy-7-phosphoheptulonate synthase